MERLPTIIERRVNGVEPYRDQLTGLTTMRPKVVGYLIGHGQQLARKRLAAHVNAQPDVVENTSRQVKRADARADRKARARHERDEAFRRARVAMQARRRARKAAREAKDAA